MLKKCCCVGHREIPKDKTEYLEKRLREEIEQAVKDGYTVFASGFAAGADRCFTAIVAEMKKTHSGLLLEANIPNRDELERLEMTPELETLLAACDAKGCMQAERFNQVRGARFLVEESERVIAVYDGREDGNTAMAVRYAKELGRDLRIIGQ